MSVSRLFTQLFSAFFFNLKLRLEEICLLRDCISLPALQKLRCSLCVVVMVMVLQKCFILILESAHI